MNKHIDPILLKKIEEMENNKGIDIKEIPDGTKLNIQTSNTLYHLTKTSSDNVIIQGGKYWPEPSEVRINGSTFGGSCIKQDWIGESMNLEIYDAATSKVITTSSIKTIKILVEGD